MSFGPKSANTFRSNEAPVHYVAGLGRGAVGFTTRSDIGPARIDSGTDNANPFATPNFGQAPAGYIAGRGRAMGALAASQDEVKLDKDDRADYSEGNFDPLYGYQETLFAGDVYDDADKEADQVYAQVDKSMALRSKRSLESEQLAQKNRVSKHSRAAIGEQFADLKRNLSNVTSQEWESIPEVGDHSLKLKQSRKKETYTPVPDALLVGFAASTRNATDREIESASNHSSSSPSSSSLSDARSSTLTRRLDKMSDSVSGQTVVDPQGYLTGLGSLHVTSDSDISDIKRARTLLSSVTATNPHHAPGWMAAARVEKEAGKLVQARRLLRQGCEACPDSIDLWLEFASLHSPSEAKVILSQALSQIPTAVSLWVAAAQLEPDKSLQRKIVLRRALEALPHSEVLWKHLLAQEEDPQEARILLSRGVECLPHSLEMWLALAKLESHENARKVLNEARQANPQEALPWIAAAQLEEAHKNVELTKAILDRMMMSLSSWTSREDPNQDPNQDQEVTEEVVEEVEVKEGDISSTVSTTSSRSLPLAPPSLSRQEEELADRDRSRWLQEAMQAERSGFPVTCAAIVDACLKIDLKRRNLWKWVTSTSSVTSSNKAKSASSSSSSRVDPLQHESVKHLLQTWLQEADSCLHAPGFALAQPNQESSSNPSTSSSSSSSIPPRGAVETARAILKVGREIFPSHQVLWMTSIELEQSLEESAPVVSVNTTTPPSTAPSTSPSTPLSPLEILLQQAVQHCPHIEVLWLLAAKIRWTRRQDVAGARGILSQAFQFLPKSDAIILAAAKLEWESGEISRSRVLLKRAREQIHHAPRVWLKSALLERETENWNSCLEILEEALQRFPFFVKFYLMAGEVCQCLSTLLPASSNNSSSISQEPLVEIFQWKTSMEALEKAGEYYRQGVQKCPKSIPCWIEWARLEEKKTGLARARSILEMGRSKLLSLMPHLATASATSSSSTSSSSSSGSGGHANAALVNYGGLELLWRESSRLERRHGQDKLGDTLLAQALQECKGVALLWAEDVLTCARHNTKSRSGEALKHFGNSFEVVSAVARIFDREGKSDKAKKWMDRALALQPRYGDGWAYRYAWELKEGQWTKKNSKESTSTSASTSSSSSSCTAEDELKRQLDMRLKDIEIKCEEVDPNLGEMWCSITKRTENRRLSIGMKLKKVVEYILNEKTPSYGVFHS